MGAVRQLALLALLGSVAPHTRGCSKEEKEVGNCVHIYLERDFSPIQPIVFQRDGVSTTGILLLGGPELQDHCNRLEDVLECFEEILVGCYYLGDFFRFRHLVYSLRRAHAWVCADLRRRFKVLLKSLHCIEYVRTEKPGVCWRPLINETNLWQKIMRMEIGTEACSYLSSQQRCFLETHLLQQTCQEPAATLFKDLSQVFLSAWCGTAARMPSLPSLLLLGLSLCFLLT